MPHVRPRRGLGFPTKSTPQPMAIAPLVIPWGPAASPDLPRRSTAAPPAVSLSHNGAHQVLYLLLEEGRSPIVRRGGLLFFLFTHCTSRDRASTPSYQIFGGVAMKRLAIAAAMIVASASSFAQDTEKKDHIFGAGCLGPMNTFAEGLGTCIIDESRSRIWCPNGKIFDRDARWPQSSYVVRGVCTLDQVAEEKHHLSGVVKE